MSDVTVVDLGLGNIRSVVRGFERLDVAVERTSDPERVSDASRLVVPGQGAFRDGAAALRSPLGDAIRGALTNGKPFLGICLGMQLLFEGSDECPAEPGLGFFSGRVARLAGRGKVPHMGWNQVEGEHPFFDQGSWFYFVHSYVCEPEDASTIVATTDYEGSFCSAVAKGAVFACQFHPEKSQRAGVDLMKRFLS